MDSKYGLGEQGPEEKKKFGISEISQHTLSGDRDRQLQLSPTCFHSPPPRTLL